MTAQERTGDRFTHEPSTIGLVDHPKVLASLVSAIDESGWKRTALAVLIGVTPQRFSEMCGGEERRPWTLARLARLPAEIRVSFLSKWADLEGVPLDVANALRQMADALDQQPTLALLGLIPRAGPIKMTALENKRAAAATATPKRKVSNE